MTCTKFSQLKRKLLTSLFPGKTKILCFKILLNNSAEKKSNETYAWDDGDSIKND